MIIRLSQIRSILVIDLQFSLSIYRLKLRTLLNNKFNAASGLIVTSNAVMSQTSNKNSHSLQVAVLFEEPEITDLFSILIMAKGVRTRSVKPGEPLLENERIVTEPQYLNNIPEDKRTTSLLIGNLEALKSAPGMTLSRPLTETKVLEAIDKFLS